MFNHQGVPIRPSVVANCDIGKLGFELCEYLQLNLAEPCKRRDALEYRYRDRVVMLALIAGAFGVEVLPRKEHRAVVTSNMKAVFTLLPAAALSCPHPLASSLPFCLRLSSYSTFSPCHT